MSTCNTVSPKSLFDQTQRGEGVQLIDVRTPVEYREVHVPFAKNYPLDQLDPAKVSMLRKDPSQPLYVICRSGSRAGKAIEKLESAGLQNLVNVEGGTMAWDGAGLPVNRGKKAVSLERQVRIAAGALAFTGAVLGYFVHPNWIGLSAFVGAGLMFAGITDTCAMGMLIARMPWNQMGKDSANSGQGTASGGTACSTGGPTACCK